MRRAKSLPNLLTLGNAFLGLLAISKGIDALTATDPALFARHFESACWFVLGSLLLDALDGRVARMTGSFSDLGAQLDSFADAITFGVAPGLLAKMLLEHHGVLHARLNFFAAALYALMAVLRLARFNVENDHDEEHHRSFSGLPSPAAAGVLVATMLMSLTITGSIEGTGSETTLVGQALAGIPEETRASLAAGLRVVTLLMLPVLGLLMVSRVPYSHAFSALVAARGRWAMVRLVVLLLVLYVAPVPTLFALGWLYFANGLLKAARGGARGPVATGREAA